MMRVVTAGEGISIWSKGRYVRADHIFHYRQGLGEKKVFFPQKALDPIHSRYSMQGHHTWSRLEGQHYGLVDLE